jgi:hypothetical protein
MAKFLDKLSDYQLLKKESAPGFIFQLHRLYSAKHKDECE